MGGFHGCLALPGPGWQDSGSTDGEPFTALVRSADLVTLDDLLADGAEARVTGDVERLTGRPARTFGQFVADCADTFRK